MEWHLEILDKKNLTQRKFIYINNYEDEKLKTSYQLRLKCAK